MEQPETTRRKDAQENREKLLAAAREVFAAEGFDVPLDVIARKAGVGRATLYRNFADRFALGTAIFDENLCALECLAQEHLGRPECFALLIDAIVEQQIACHALVPALLTGPGAPDLHALAQRMATLFAAPLESAQRDSRIRIDLQPADLLTVLGMVSSAIAEPTPADQRRSKALRALDLVLYGIVTREPTSNSDVPEVEHPHREH